MALKRIHRRIIRTVSGTLGGLLILVGIVTWLIRYPAVQTYLVDQSQYILSDQLGVPVEIQGVDVALPAKITLGNLRLCDTQGQNLLKAGELNVSALNFPLWDYLFSSRKEHQMRISHIQLVQPEIFLYKSRIDSSLNLQYLLDAFSSGDTATTEQKLALIFEDIQLKDAHFTYIDSTLWPFQTPSGRINFDHLELKNVHLQANLSMYPDSVLALNLQDLQLKEERSGYEVRDLDLEIVNYEGLKPEKQGKLIVKRLRIQTQRTQLIAKGAFPTADLFQILDEPELLNGSLAFARGSYINLLDVDPFLEEPLPVKGRIQLAGEVRGGLQRIVSRDLALAFGENSSLRAAIDIKDYLDEEKLFLNVNMRESRISLDELQTLIPLVGLPDGMKPLRQLELVGSFKGKVDDFEVDAAMDTDLGKIVADVALQLPPRVKVMTYEGTIKTTDFNVDALGIIPDRLSHRLNFNGEIKGYGSSLNNFDVFFDAGLGDSDIAGFGVDSAQINVEVANQEVVGDIYWSDATGWADLDVDISLAQSPAKYQVEGKVRGLDLKTYEILDEPILFSSDLSVDLLGDSLENFNGRLKLLKSTLENLNRKDGVKIPDVFVDISSREKEAKYVNFKSSFLDADLAGTFQYARALELIERLAEETNLFFSNNDSLIQDYYQKKVPDTTTTKVLVGLAVKDSLNPLLAFFDLPYEVAAGTFVGGEFLYEGKKGELKQIDQLKIRMQSDSMRLEGVQVKQIEADLLLLKPAQQNDIRLDADLVADSTIVGPSFGLEALSTRVSLQNNVLLSSVDFIQRESRGEVSFASTTKFLDDGTIKAQVDPIKSSIRIYGDTLMIEPGDSIIIQDGRTQISNLILQTNDRFYRLDGIISDRPEDKFTFQIGKFDLANIQEFYPIDFEIEGDFIANITGSGVLGKPHFEIQSLIQDFVYEGYDYGNIYVSGVYDDSLDEVFLNTHLMRAQDTLLVMDGAYHLSDTVSPVDFTLSTIEGVPLNYISPFVEGELSGIDGKVRLNQFNISGKLADPQVNGEGFFDEAGFKVEYLKTRYVLNGKMDFNNQKILLKDLKVKDGKGAKAELYGDIRHRALQEFTFNLQLASAKNFMVMNTRKEDNDLFYGKLLLNDALAYISGDLSDIKVEAITAFAPGSEINLPITDEDEYGRPDYIVFEGEESKGLTAETGLQGFDISLTALATEELGVNMIFDERVGDIIRARGEGDLTLEIDEAGKFTIKGDYRVTRGDYLFT
ncbi:MAG: translocation/assembly module TamB domain-containing protein, partial [Bacteroidota bacterium]